MHDYITNRDKRLRSLLQNLPGRKLILTNSIRCHAETVLSALGVADQFCLILDTLDQFPNPKPSPDAFWLAMDAVGAKDPARCAMVDESSTTIRAAKKAGLFAVLVGKDNAPEGDADLVIPSIHDLGKYFIPQSVG